MLELLEEDQSLINNIIIDNLLKDILPELNADILIFDPDNILNDDIELEEDDLAYNTLNF